MHPETIRGGCLASKRAGAVMKVLMVMIHWCATNTLAVGA
jgi:hypothetical protein